VVPRNPAAAGAAIASLFLGSVAVATSFLTPLAAVPAVFGVPLGIWGLTSTRRAMALSGILLCCIGIAFSGIHAVIAFHDPDAARGISMVCPPEDQRPVLQRGIAQELPSMPVRPRPNGDRNGFPSGDSAP
jgi:hypothetical protein